MTLEDMKKACEVEASLAKVHIPDANGNMILLPFNSLSEEERKKYIKIIKREITNKYCDYDEISFFSEDEIERERATRYKSAYWSATLLCYWGKIFDWIKTSMSLGLRPTDFFDWLTDSVHDAFYYRSWRPRRRVRPNDPNSEWMDNPQYKPEEADAADKSINFFCGARRGKEYQAANKDKRKANYQNLSIDQSFDEDGYSILDRKGLSSDGRNGMGARGLVSELLTQNKVVEAIIIDSIAYGDAYKETKTKVVTEVTDEQTGQVTEQKTYNYKQDFNPRKLVKFLSDINEDYFTNYFNKEYHIKDYNPILSKLKSLNNNKLYKEIEKTLLIIKRNPNLLAYLA